MRRFLALLLLSLATAAPADVSRVFPNGARQGASVTLEFGGEALPDPAVLVVEGEGMRALGPFVKGVGKVEIAPDAAPGVRQLRLVGPKGATSPRPFSIGTLPEAAEKEPNNAREQAQPVEQLPITLNGSLPNRPDIDTFRVSLKQGECLVVAGEARVLGAPTNLVVRIRDLAGTELRVQMDHRTRDPLLGFTAPADGDYLVELQEVMNNYSEVNADYVYRVTLTKGPWLDTVSPPGARRGSTARLTFSGWNLGGQSGPSQLATDVAVPSDAPDRYPVTAGVAPNSVLLATGSAPDALEAETEGDPPQLLSLPQAVHGTFGRRGDRDRFRFSTEAGETLLLNVDARELGSFADPVLTLLDGTGKFLQLVDDAEGSSDPRLYWKAPAAGVYTAVLRDVAGTARGGPEFFYRFSISRPEPEVRLTTPAPTLELKPGAKLEIAVSVYQAYQPSALTLHMEGLPAGVTATAVPVAASPARAGTTQAKVILTAAPDAAPGHASFRIVARVGDAPVAATASWVLSKDRSGTLATGKTERLLLVVPTP